jgi:hypothetical protein
VQFAVGFLNHRQYQKTQIPSKYNIYHIWFGRLVILLAIMNGFLYVLTLCFSLVLFLTNFLAASLLPSTDDMEWF